MSYGIGDCIPGSQETKHDEPKNVRAPVVLHAVRSYRDLVSGLQRGLSVSEGLRKHLKMYISCGAFTLFCSFFRNCCQGTCRRDGRVGSTHILNIKRTYPREKRSGPDNSSPYASLDDSTIFQGAFRNS